MLVRVATEELQLGMYVHAIEGSWIDHPFWRSRFLLTEQAQLDKVIASDVAHVVIDAERSLVAPRQVEPPRPATLPSLPNSLLALPGRRMSPRERAAEVRKAASTIRKSKAAVMGMFEDARLGKAIRTGDMAPLVEQISASVAGDPTIILNIARLKNKDEYTYLHSVAVCALMINLARTMGLDESSIRDIGMAGLLHDVGKMAIPDSILLKPGRLDDVEYEAVRNHPRRGHEILCGAQGASEIALDVCLHHHEKMDGTGYPDRLHGVDLSLVARMSSVCDVYDAVTSQRPYNQPWSASQALQLMQGWKGHFDEAVFASFVESLGILPVGTLIRVNSDRLAVVTGESRADFSMPKARIFYSSDKQGDEPPLDIEVSRKVGGYAVSAIENPADWGFHDWAGYSKAILDRALA